MAMHGGGIHPECISVQYCLGVEEVLENSRTQASNQEQREPTPLHADANAWPPRLEGLRTGKEQTNRAIAQCIGTSCHRSGHPSRNTPVPGWRVRKRDMPDEYNKGARPHRKCDPGYDSDSFLVVINSACSYCQCT